MLWDFYKTVIKFKTVHPQTIYTTNDSASTHFLDAVSRS